MRNERAEVLSSAEAIKGAGVHIAALFFNMVEELEKTGYLKTLPVADDEGLVESLVETIAQSGHFEKLHGDGLPAYKLFVAAAKAQTLDARTADGKAALRAMDAAQQGYIDAHTDEEGWRVSDLESAHV